MTAEVSQAALQLHRSSIVFDALSISYVLEEPYAARMQEGGVTATICTIAIEEDWNTTIHLVESALEQIDSNPVLTLALRAEDVAQAKAEGKVAVIIGFQGSSMLEGKKWRLKLLHRLGLRCLQLTYTAGCIYGDGCGEHRDAGLTFAGRELIDQVHELNMLLDLSHCGKTTTLEAIRQSHGNT